MLGKQGQEEMGAVVLEQDNNIDENCGKKLTQLALNKQLLALDATIRSFVWTDWSETVFGFRVSCLQLSPQWDATEQLKKSKRKGDIIRLHFKWSPILQDLLRNCRMARNLSKTQLSNDERDDMGTLLQTVMTCLKDDIDRLALLLPKRPDCRSQQILDNYRNYILEMDATVYATLYHVACEFRSHANKLSFLVKTLG